MINRPRPDSNRRIPDLQSGPLVHLGTRPRNSNVIDDRRVLQAVRRASRQQPQAATAVSWSQLSSNGVDRSSICDSTELVEVLVTSYFPTGSGGRYVPASTCSRYRSRSSRAAATCWGLNFTFARAGFAFFSGSASTFGSSRGGSQPGGPNCTRRGAIGCLRGLGVPPERFGGRNPLAHHGVHGEHGGNSLVVLTFSVHSVCSVVTFVRTSWCLRFVSCFVLRISRFPRVARSPSTPSHAPCTSAAGACR